MKCQGLHCDGCGKGQLTAGAVIVIILFLLGLMFFETHKQQIDNGVNDFVQAMIDIMIGIASLIMASITGFITYKIVRRNNRKKTATHIQTQMPIHMTATITKPMAAPKTAKQIPPYKVIQLHPINSDTQICNN